MNGTVILLSNQLVLSNVCQIYCEYAAIQFVKISICATIVSSNECFLSGFPLLIAGTLDYLRTVNEELVSKFKDPLVIYHEGNHKVPRLGKYKCDCSPSVNYSLSYVYALIGLGTSNQLGSAFQK
jgi:hypothetical protein